MTRNGRKNRSEVLNRKSNKLDIQSISGKLSNYGIFIAFVLICVVLAFLSSNFFSLQNIITILRQVSINGILAIGVTFVILGGGIDLSLGSVVALSGVVTAIFAQNEAYALIVPLTMGLLTGLGAGAVNGLVITKGKTAPFIVTLGMMTIVRGLALVVSGGRPVSGFSKSFNFIGGGEIAGIPFPVLLFVAIIILSSMVLNRTIIGRHVYAVGGNENAAWASGINIHAVKIFTYCICGGLAGLAGIVLASRITTGQPNAGIAYELDAIAAVVIGGTSLSGGTGSIRGTVVGVLIIGVINNGLDLLNISSYYQQIIKGIIIISAVLIDRKNAR